MWWLWLRWSKWGLIYMQIDMIGMGMSHLIFNKAWHPFTDWSVWLGSRLGGTFMMLHRYSLWTRACSEWPGSWRWGGRGCQLNTPRKKNGLFLKSPGGTWYRKEVCSEEWIFVCYFFTQETILPLCPIRAQGDTDLFIQLWYFMGSSEKSVCFLLSIYVHM